MGSSQGEASYQVVVGPRRYQVQARFRQRGGLVEDAAEKQCVDCRAECAATRGDLGSTDPCPFAELANSIPRPGTPCEAAHER
jgi:hypothetical protein